MHGNGKSSPSAFQDLKKKEEAIQLMQKKIAELEKKKAEQGRGRVQSPKVISANEKRMLVSNSIQTGEDGATIQVTDITGSSIPTNDEIDTRQATSREASNSMQLSLDQGTELERKRQRRDQLQSGLSGMYAEAEEARRRIAEHEREQKRWEAILQAKMDGRKSLVDELEMLGIEVNENNIAELEIVKKKEELSDLKTEVAQDKNGRSDVSVSLGLFAIILPAAISSLHFALDFHTDLLALSQANLGHEHSNTVLISSNDSSRSPVSISQPELSTIANSSHTGAASPNIGATDSNEPESRSNQPGKEDSTSQALSPDDSTEEGEIAEDFETANANSFTQSPRPGSRKSDERNVTAESSDVDMGEVHMPDHIEKPELGESISQSTSTEEKTRQEQDISSVTDEMDMEDSGSYEPPDASPRDDISDAKDRSSIDSRPSEDVSDAILQKSPRQSESRVESPANVQPVSSEQIETAESPKPSLVESSVRIKSITCSGY